MASDIAGSLIFTRGCVRCQLIQGRWKPPRTEHGVKKDSLYEFRQDEEHGIYQEYGLRCREHGVVFVESVMEYVLYMLPVDEVCRSSTIERFSGLDLHMLHMIKPYLWVAVGFEATSYTLFTDISGTSVIRCISEMESVDRIFDIVERLVGISYHERHRSDL